MPNTPAQIGEGMTVWTAAEAVSEEQRGWAQSILGTLGRELYVADENYLDMATALSGTGPAYIFLLMEAMIDAGVHLGFPRYMAQELVLQTVLGSARYAMRSGQHMAELRNGVTSPGGTTASALYELERGGLRTVLSDAIWAAYRRSAELGKGK
jgi:pyrroline-5-carboxylate reductase